MEITAVSGSLLDGNQQTPQRHLWSAPSAALRAFSRSIRFSLPLFPSSLLLCGRQSPTPRNHITMTITLHTFPNSRDPNGVTALIEKDGGTLSHFLGPVTDGTIFNDINTGAFAGVAVYGPWRTVAPGQPVVAEVSASQPGTVYVQDSSDGVTASDTQAADQQPVAGGSIVFGLRFTTTLVRYRLGFAPAVTGNRIRIDSQQRP